MDCKILPRAPRANASKTKCAQAYRPSKRKLSTCFQVTLVYPLLFFAQPSINANNPHRLEHFTQCPFSKHFSFQNGLDSPCKLTITATTYKAFASAIIPTVSLGEKKKGGEGAKILMQNSTRYKQCSCNLMLIQYAHAHAILCGLACNLRVTYSYSPYVDRLNGTSN